MKRISLFFFCLLNLTIGFCQNGNWMFDRKSISEGLSNTWVSDIIKDSKGFMWIATHNGLNRYNAYSFEVFKNDPNNVNSLSSDKVNSVFEDREGRIWVGTNYGLNRYNRETGTFTIWVPDTVASPHGNPRLVGPIVQDDRGMLWLGTHHKSVIRFDPEKEVFDQPLPDPELDNRYNNSWVRCLTIDKDQNLWIGTNGHGIVRYDIENGTVERWLSQDDESIPMELGYCFSLYQDKKGNLWAGTYIGGLAKYNPQTNNFRLIPNPNNPNATTKNGVMAIKEDAAGNLILGTNGGGLFFFDPNTETFFKNYAFSPIDQHSVSDDFIGEIFIDESDIIWLGTENGGVSIYDPNRRKFDLYKKTQEGENNLPGNLINAIHESENGTLWIGTENNGFASLNRSTNKYNQFFFPNVQRDKGNTFIKTITTDGNNGIYAGAHMGGVAHIDSNGIVLNQFSPELQPENPQHYSDTEVNTLLFENDSILWVGGYRSLTEKEGDNFTDYCKPENIIGEFCSEPTWAVSHYKEDYLIIGYVRDGIRFFNKKEKRFESEFSAENSDLSHNTINSIYTDSKGRLWIGTENGLNQFHFEDSTFTTIYESDGLPDNKILGILEDDKANLWISTSYGLCRYNPDNSDFKNFYESDGLQSNVFRLGAYHKSKSGELFFGGVGGFNAFYPNQIQSNPNPPPVVFTDFQLFNETVIPGPNSPLKIKIEEADTIELNYDQSIFSFEFAALNYTLSEENEYKYLLEGFNSDWQSIGSRRYITFTNLAAGTYTLKVKACNNDGVWNEEGTSILLIIHPPFWETWWFRTLVILTGLLLIYGIYKWRIRSIERQNRALEQEVKIRTQEVVEQKDEIASQKELVDQKNQDITASIRYSKRIQESFLPDLSELKQPFADAFVFFKPKDIVSGDFYWIETTENKTEYLICVADCTGHGVPGAMVSVLGNNGLNRAVNELNLSETNLILDNLNNFVKRAFDSNVQDGMDLALCKINAKTNRLEFSGANNPVWIARDGIIHVIKGTKQPIGKYRDSKPFEKETFQLQSEDWVFLFSDGYPDQFGGAKGKKYKYARLKETLLKFNAAKHGAFENYLNIEFDNWKGELEQIDDICLLGIQIK